MFPGLLNGVYGFFSGISFGIVLRRPLFAALERGCGPFLLLLALQMCVNRGRQSSEPNGVGIIFDFAMELQDVNIRIAEDKNRAAFFLLYFLSRLE